MMLLLADTKFTDLTDTVVISAGLVFFTKQGNDLRVFSEPLQLFGLG